MRITFEPSNQRRSEPVSSRRISLVLLLILAALLLIMLDSQGQLDGVKNYAQRVLQPVSQTLTQTRMAFGEAVGNLTGQGAAQARIAELEQKLSAAQDKIVQLQAAQDQVSRLEQQLQIQVTYNWQMQAANVVQGSTDTGRRIVRINKGSVDKLGVGMAVVGKEGGSPAALIGVVDKVYAQTAEVLLITDYGSTISARTAGTDTPAEGLIAGQWQLGSRIKLTDVSRDVPLAEGQYIVTAGLSKALNSQTPVAQVPPDVPIGTIISVAQSGHSQTAEVQPFVDPDRVRSVWVITGQK